MTFTGSEVAVMLLYLLLAMLVGARIYLMVFRSSDYVELMKARRERSRRRRQAAGQALHALLSLPGWLLRRQPSPAEPSAPPAYRGEPQDTAAPDDGSARPPTGHFSEPWRNRP